MNDDMWLLEGDPQIVIMRVATLILVLLGFVLTVVVFVT